MLPTALVPVRISPTAKRRLAHVLSAEDRMHLVRSLFDHVVSVLMETRLSVVALAPHDVNVPDGVAVMRDADRGLNGAVGAAVRTIGPPILVVHADLPRLAVEDVDRILSSDAEVVIARAHDGGTNGLLLRREMPTAFGPSSALLHASRARSLGLTARVVDLAGFAIDVDDEATLAAAGNAYARGTRP